MGYTFRKSSTRKIYLRGVRVNLATLCAFTWPQDGAAAPCAQKQQQKQERWHFWVTTSAVLPILGAVCACSGHQAGAPCPEVLEAGPLLKMSPAIAILHQARSLVTFLLLRMFNCRSLYFNILTVVMSCCKIIYLFVYLISIQIRLIAHHHWRCQ